MRYNLSRDFWQNEPKLGHRDADRAFSMSVDLPNKYDWALRPVVVYPSVDRLIEVLEDKRRGDRIIWLLSETSLEFGRFDRVLARTRPATQPAARRALAAPARIA